MQPRTYQVVSQWGGGFQGSVTVANGLQRRVLRVDGHVSSFANGQQVQPVVEHHAQPEAEPRSRHNNVSYNGSPGGRCFNHIRLHRQLEQRQRATGGPLHTQLT